MFFILFGRKNRENVSGVIKVQPIYTKLTMISRFRAVVFSITKLFNVESMVADIPFICVRNVKDTVMACAPDAAVSGVCSGQNHITAFRLFQRGCALAVANVVIGRAGVITTPCEIADVLSFKNAGGFSKIGRCYIHRIADKMNHIFGQLYTM